MPLSSACQLNGLPFLLIQLILSFFSRNKIMASEGASIITVLPGIITLGTGDHISVSFGSSLLSVTINK